MTLAKFSEDLPDVLASKGGDVNNDEDLQDKDNIMFYFSAHRCPPCRGLTPKLADRYHALQEA